MYLYELEPEFIVINNQTINVESDNPADFSSPISITIEDNSLSKAMLADSKARVGEKINNDNLLGEVNQIDLGGITAFQTKMESKTSLSKNVLFERNNKVHIIQLIIGKENPDVEEVEFDQILSTFEFTDNINPTATISNSSKNPVGQFCGGIAGIICPDGYTCKYEGNYPDAGGTCVVN